MFIKKNRDGSKYIDSIGPIRAGFKNDNDPSKINASVGSLCGEDNQLVAFDSVYNSYNNIDNIKKATYAESSFGNDEYNKTILDFVLEGKVQHAKNIATAGGTGSISLPIAICLDEGDKILVPEVAWGNYNIICKEYGVTPVYYDGYDVDGLLSKFDELDRIFIVINSPCQNPCGFSYTYEEWKKIIDKLNNCGKEAIVLNDVAYIDYAFDKENKKYFELLDTLNDNVLFLIGYSCSKTFSYYGMRLGTLIAINNNEEFLDYFINQCARHIRTSYSNLSNSAMINITDVIKNHKEEFLNEKQKYIDLMKQRTELFLKEADENNLEYYPYKEGFFVTLKFDDNTERDRVHKNFFDNHIYCIKVNKGIRIALCSIPLENIKGLSARLKALY